MSLQTKDRANHSTKNYLRAAKQAIASRMYRVPDLVWLMIIFVGLFVGITIFSHLFGLRFFAGEDMKAKWGSISDWFSGVAGISIGLAGSSIAIWLAYRVEKLTTAQNQLANAQSWRESYIDSGEIKARAEIAGQAYLYIQEIYTNLLNIEKIDIQFAIKESEIIQRSKQTGHPDREEKLKAKGSYFLTASPYLEKIMEALAGLISLLPTTRIRDRNAQDVLGVSPEEVKRMARYYLEYILDEYENRAARIAKRLIDKDDTEVSASDAIHFLMFHTSVKNAKIGLASDKQSEPGWPADFSEFVNESNSASPGLALSMHGKYLPTSKFKTEDKCVEVNWILALCDDILNEVNPYRYAHEELEADFASENISQRQRDRLSSSMRFIISNNLPQTHYIRNVFPDMGYAEKDAVAGQFSNVTRAHARGPFEHRQELRKRLQAISSRLARSAKADDPAK